MDAHAVRFETTSPADTVRPNNPFVDLRQPAHASQSLPECEVSFAPLGRSLSGSFFLRALRCSLPKKGLAL